MKLSFFLSSSGSSSEEETASKKDDDSASVFTNSLSYFGLTIQSQSTKSTQPDDQSASCCTPIEEGDEDDNDEDERHDHDLIRGDFEQDDVSRQYFDHLTDRFQNFAAKKSVSWGVTPTVHYQDRPFSSSERDLYWYDKDALDAFSEIAQIEARTAFPRKRGKNSTRSILAAFDICAKAKSEQAMELHKDLIDQTNLQAMYSMNQIGNCVGLENHALRLVRGDPKGLVSFVLDQTKSHLQRGSFKKKNASVRRQELMWNTMAHVSECISRPSRFLANELALAQARALEAER